MPELELSEAYSDLKQRYQKMKDNLTMANLKNKNLHEQNEKLLKRVGQLQEENEKMKEDATFVLPNNKGKGSRSYVGVNKYSKQVRLTEYFIDLYHKEKNKNKSTQ